MAGPGCLLWTGWGLDKGSLQLLRDFMAPITLYGAKIVVAFLLRSFFFGGLYKVCKKLAWDSIHDLYGIVGFQRSPGCVVLASQRWLRHGM